MKYFVPSFLFFGLMSFYLSAEAGADSPEQESPWLLTPTFSSNPKLGNSVGALGAYLHKFDEESPTSMFGVMGSYSDTDSSVYGVFGNTYFAADQHRLKFAVVKGKIENEYEDYLGTGLNAITTDDMTVNYLSYTKRLKKDWFVGAQLLSMDYDIVAGDDQTQMILDEVGLDGLNSTGVGVVIERDTRDTQNSPQHGALLNLNNFAFREGLGGDDNYDAYTAEYSQFISHGQGHVLAFKLDGRWTSDAPTSGYSSVNLRGYTRGEYLAPHSATFQVEERYSLNSKWGATAFVGAACLFGDDAHCDDKDNWFPAIGAGVTYMLKVEERMVVRAEVAVGKDDSRGFYIAFGNSF